MNELIDAEYSLVQFVPSPRRAEAVNIGIAVSYPDTNDFDWKFVDSKRLAAIGKQYVKNSGSAQRKVSFQTRSLVAHFQRMRDALARATEINVSADIDRLRRRLGNEVRLTPLHPTRTTKPLTETTLILFDELVARPQTQKTGRQRVDVLLRERLQEWGVSDFVETKIPQARQVLGGTRRVKLHARYQNGCMNYIRAERLETLDQEPFVQLAALSTVVAEALREEEGAKLTLYLAAPDEVASELRAVLREKARVVTESDAEELRTEIVKARALHGPR